MASFARVVGGGVAGILLAFVLVVAVEGFSAVVHPFPPDFGGTTEEVCRHVERYPAWVLAAVVPLWAGTALASTWLAARWGGRGCGLFVGLLIFLALASNLAMLPYPIWFKLASLIAVPLAIWRPRFGAVPA